MDHQNVNQFTLRIGSGILSEFLIRIGLFVINLFGNGKKARGLKGKSLSRFPQLYPYRFDPNNSKVLQFSIRIFLKAMNEFIRKDNEIAGAQLLFIGEENNIIRELQEDERKVYAKFRKKFQKALDLYREDTTNLINQLTADSRIEGDKDNDYEITVHDCRNPSKSIAWISNNLSGREVDSPANNLILSMITKGNPIGEKRYQCEINRRRFSSRSSVYTSPTWGIIAVKCRNEDDNSPKNVSKPTGKVKKVYYPRILNIL